MTPTNNNTVGKPSSLVSSMAARVATASAPAPAPAPATPLAPVASNSRPTAGRPLPPQTPDSAVYGAAAGPSTPWTAHSARTSFFVDIDLDDDDDDDDKELLPPSFSSPGLSRCSSEPPHAMPGIQSPRQTRSRSVSRTPSLPASNDSRTDLKSLPVTPQVVEQTAFLPDQLSLASSSAPTSPFQTTHMPLAVAPPPPPPAAVPAGPPRTRGDSAPVTPNTLPHHHHHHHHHHHGNTLQFAPGHTHSLSSSHVPETQHAHVLHMQYQAAALRSTQYTDLFLFEPHEYDSITDGELVRLYDRGVIDGRVLEQIVDASIRIQRACTDADRAVSIKTRRAMIRHALEE